MRIQTFQTSVAAGAAPVNILPDGLALAPEAGFFTYSVVGDPVTGLTAQATHKLVRKGNVPVVDSSPVPMNNANAQFVGPDLRNLAMPPVAVDSGENLQLLIGGGAGATQTVRATVYFAATDELAQLLALFKSA
jgi:hypothetical protein